MKRSRLGYQAVGVGRLQLERRVPGSCLVETGVYESGFMSLELAKTMRLVKTMGIPLGA